MRLVVIALVFGTTALIVGVGAEAWHAHFHQPTLQSIHYNPAAVYEFSARKRD